MFSFCSFQSQTQNFLFIFPNSTHPWHFIFICSPPYPSSISYISNLFPREPEILSKTVYLLKLCFSLENLTVDFICTRLKHMYLHLDPEKITLVKVQLQVEAEKRHHKMMEQLLLQIYTRLSSLSSEITGIMGPDSFPMELILMPTKLPAEKIWFHSVPQ